MTLILKRSLLKNINPSFISKHPLNYDQDQYFDLSLHFIKKPPKPPLTRTYHCNHHLRSQITNSDPLIKLHPLFTITTKPF